MALVAFFEARKDGAYLDWQTIQDDKVKDLKDLQGPFSYAWIIPPNKNGRKHGRTQTDPKRG